jgi:hypothetical protein
MWDVITLVYLTAKDEDILFKTNKLLADLFHEGKLSPEQEPILAEFYQFCRESEQYSYQRRQKSKKFVQEKRKIDKTYAHTRNKTQKEVV